MCEQVSFVLSQSTRLTGRQTDGSTERPWQYRALHYMQSHSKKSRPSLCLCGNISTIRHVKVDTTNALPYNRTALKRCMHQHWNALEQEACFCSLARNVIMRVILLPKSSQGAWWWVDYVQGLHRNVCVYVCAFHSQQITTQINRKITQKAVWPITHRSFY